jgi:hypothetical protein
MMAVGATIGTLACDEGNCQLDEKVTMKSQEDPRSDEEKAAATI